MGTNRFGAPRVKGDAILSGPAPHEAGLDGLRSGPPANVRSQEEIERLCMLNLLANPEERVFFKDLESRFLLVSAGYVAALAPGCSPTRWSVRRTSTSS